MLRYLTKHETWQDLDNKVHSELGWPNAEIHLKTWQDAAVYRYVKEAQGKRIAEIGGGNSRILRKIAPHNSCVNVDKLEGQHGGPKGDQNIPGVTNVRAFLGEFNGELEDNSFDHVISVSVIEHVPHTAADLFISDMQRILKIGGTAIHAIDLYVGDEPLHNSQHRLGIYAQWLARHGLEPLEPIAAHHAVFSTAMATNPDLMMWHWNRSAPALKEVRETCQSVSLIMGFRRTA